MPGSRLIGDREVLVSIGRPAGLRRFDQQPQCIAVRRARGGTVRADAIHRRQHLPLLQRGRQFLRLASRTLDLKMHQAIERNRRRDLALDERVELTHVSRDDGDETERPAGVTPCEAARNAQPAAIADS